MTEAEAILPPPVIEGAKVEGKCDDSYPSGLIAVLGLLIASSVIPVGFAAKKIKSMKEEPAATMVAE